MRCQEVRRRLTELSLGDGSPDPGEDIRRHIASCPACAQEVRAYEKLCRSIRDTGVSDFTDAVPLSAVRSLVENRAAQIAHERKWSTIMSRVTQSFARPAYIVPSAAIIVAAVLTLTLLPLQVDESGAYHVAFAGVDKGLALQEYGLQKVLVRLGISDASVEVGNCETACDLTIADLRSEEDVGKVVTAMLKLSDCELLEIARDGDVNVFIPDKKEITFDERGNVSCDFVHQLSDEDQVLIDIVVNEVRFGEWTDADWVSNDSCSLRLVELKNCSNMANALLDTLTMSFGVCGKLPLTDNKENVAFFGEIPQDPSAESVNKTSTSTGAITGFQLNQNYPNPFNAGTTISFTVPDGGGAASLQIYNIRGQLVKTLVDRYMTAGTHQFTWNGDDAQGNAVASGVYLYRLTAGPYVETKKMSLLR